MEKARSDPASIHPRIAAWYKLGKGRCQRVHSKAAGTCRITGGFALAPQTSTWGDVSLGAVEPECGGNDALCPRGLPRKCLYPICTKPRCVRVCLRGRTALSPCDPVRQPRRCCFLPKGGIVCGATARPPVSHACSE